jgi:hypothetical protein
VKKILIILICFTVKASFAYARGGDIEGNGGNVCALEFTMRAEPVYEAIRENEFYKAHLNLEKLKSAVENVSVIVTLNILRDQNGGSAMAINDGVNRIWLSQSDWCNAFVGSRTALVFHELLGVSEPGIDFQYQLSRSLFQILAFDESNFANYIQTGTDFRTAQLEFNHLASVSENEASIQSTNLSTMAWIHCDERASTMDLYKSGSREPENFLSSYTFGSHRGCEETLSRAKLTDQQTLKISVGLDSMRVLRHN